MQDPPEAFAVQLLPASLVQHLYPHTPIHVVVGPDRVDLAVVPHVVPLPEYVVEPPRVLAAAINLPNAFLGYPHSLLVLPATRAIIDPMTLSDEVLEYIVEKLSELSRADLIRITHVLFWMGSCFETSHHE